MEDFDDDEEERTRPKLKFITDCCCSLMCKGLEDEDGIVDENDEHVELKDTELEQRRCNMQINQLKRLRIIVVINIFNTPNQKN